MKTILITAVVLLIAQFSFAQDMTAARQRATEKTAQMKNDLNLTQTQEPQVLALNIELEEEIEKINTRDAFSKTEIKFNPKIICLGIFLCLNVKIHFFFIFRKPRRYCLRKSTKQKSQTK